MDIHKPKPWHGVREFLKEYAIIVVGVLTALGAEQGVEWMHWRHQTEMAREALALDFQGVLKNASERLAVTPCLEHRIEDITRVVDRASSNGKLPPLGPLATVPVRPWNLKSWDTLEASQTLAHMPRDEMTAYSNIALYLANRQAIRDQERHTWALLNALSGPGRRFGEAEEAEVRGLLSLASSDAGNMATSTRLLPGMIRDTRLLSEAQTLAAQKAGTDLVTRAEICRPIGPPPQISGGMLALFEAQEARAASEPAKP